MLGADPNRSKHIKGVIVSERFEVPLKEVWIVDDDLSIQARQIVIAGTLRASNNPIAGGLDAPVIYLGASESVTITGQILAGNGFDAPPGAAPTRGGNGGDIVIQAPVIRCGFPEVAGGDGGAVAGGGAGGDGGSVVLIGSSGRINPFGWGHCVADGVVRGARGFPAAREAMEETEVMPDTSLTPGSLPSSALHCGSGHHREARGAMDQTGPTGCVA